MNRWVISDTHFGHEKMAEIRGFSTVEAMNQRMIDAWCDTVNPGDTVYHLGDVAMSRRWLAIIPALPGRKILVKGNHDIFPLKDYLAAGFKDIRGCVVREKSILTHLPIHEDELDRFNQNIHGHLHDGEVLHGDGIYFDMPDLRYQNACVEKHAYGPVLLAELES